MSYLVEVQADNTGTWASNALRFVKHEDALSYGSDLFSRWMAVKAWRVVESTDPPEESAASWVRRRDARQVAAQLEREEASSPWELPA